METGVKMGFVSTISLISFSLPPSQHNCTMDQMMTPPPSSGSEFPYKTPSKSLIQSSLLTRRSNTTHSKTPFHPKPSQRPTPSQRPASRSSQRRRPDSKPHLRSSLTDGDTRCSPPLDLLSETPNSITTINTHFLQHNSSKPIGKSTPISALHLHLHICASLHN